MYEIRNFIGGKHETRLESHVPTLYIGLGGTGRDVLMRLRKRLYDNDGRPDGHRHIRYLMLDMDFAQWWPGGATVEQFEPVKPQPGEVIDCRINTTQFDSVFDSLEKQCDGRFAGWLKPGLRNVGAGAVAAGSGGERQFGRLAFVLKYDEIRERILAHLRGLLEDAAHLGAESLQAADVYANGVEIVIVASLAGGVGSGMLLDTAYLVKDIFRSRPTLRNLHCKHVTVIAVMPSAFEQVEGGKYFKRLQQNAYGVLLELEHYGGRRTSDDVFLGQVRGRGNDRNRVGFVAPWKCNEFIDGQGWDVCYLIDGINHRHQNAPLPLPDVYQMIADYLFLDFEPSAFAVQKRSARCNLSQWQNDMLVVRVRNPAIRDSQGNNVQPNGDFVFATRNSCAFSSFGLSEISFSRERIYRAAGYLLASRLVLERWLGNVDAFPESDYETAAQEDFYQREGGPSFETESLVPCVTPDWCFSTGACEPSFRTDSLLAYLYRDGKNSWFQDALRDCQNMEGMPHNEGSAKLAGLLAKHEKLLQIPPAGCARQTLLKRAKTLVDTVGQLPPLHRRLFEAARRRADRMGVAATRKLLDYYRAETAAVVKDACESPCEGRGLLRLREADSLSLPARAVAQRIEFPRACHSTFESILGCYRVAAWPYVDWIMDDVRVYLGDEDARQPPAKRERQDTLGHYFQEAEERLRELGGHLRQRFERFTKEEDTSNRQLLAPSNWAEKDYNDQIDRRLEATPDISASPTGLGFNWQRFEERFFAQLHVDQPQEYDSNFASLTTLLDRWLERFRTNPEKVAAIGEVLATACRNVLLQVGLDLKEYHDGCVIDLLQFGSENDRESRLRKLVEASAPYLSMDLQTQAVMANNYKPQFNNLIGLREGIIPAESTANKVNIKSQIEGLTKEVEASIGSLQELSANPASIILCREVWGVPLQYYSHLDNLHAAYMERKEQVDECHINTYECWEDLPDVRPLAPETYERIGANVETILLSVVLGTITCRQGRWYIVRDPGTAVGAGANAYLGKRISRMIRNVCEEDEVLTYLRSNQIRWENKAQELPKTMALVYASCLWTYASTGTEYQEGPDGVSPLRNCMASLLRRYEQLLSDNDEGRRWLAHVKCPNPTDVVGQVRWDALYDEWINEKRVLFRRSDLVPIWEIDWTKLEQVQLPEARVATPAVEAGG